MPVRGYLLLVEYWLDPRSCTRDREVIAPRLFHLRALSKSINFAGTVRLPSPDCRESNRLLQRYSEPAPRPRDFPSRDSVSMLHQTAPTLYRDRRVKRIAH